MDIRKQKFTLSPYLPLRFMGVIYGGVIRKGDHVDYDREIIYDQKGENYALDWAGVHSYYDNKETEELPIVLLLPGLTGNSSSSYVRDSVLYLKKEGFRVVAFNYKGVGIPQQTEEIFDY